MRRILIVSVLFLVSLSPTLAGQSSQSVERHTVPGAINLVPESPVQMAEPSYTLERAARAPYQLQIVDDAVTVTNTSGRDIRRLMLVFSYKPGAIYGGVESRAAVDQLRAGESRQVQSGTTIREVSESLGWGLTVTPTGAEFADGSYWAPPRDGRRPLLMDYLSQPASYLSVRKFKWTDNAYQAMLQVGNARVVAYRLGIVKDTADDFEVRLGEWVELNDEQTIQRAVFADEAKSLTADQVFPREAYRRPAGPGKEVIDWGGVAIFVAELRFADGRTWQQGLTREALLWCN